MFLDPVLFGTILLRYVLLRSFLEILNDVPVLKQHEVMLLV